MHRVLVLGAGKIGTLISVLLAESGSYFVHLADRSAHSAAVAAAAHPDRAVQAHAIDVTDKAALHALLLKHPVSAVISALPFHCNSAVAELCRHHRLHYFDLTEDVQTTQAVLAIAQDAQTAFVPQCGLAPGFISIAANALIARFDEVSEAKLRVGALPQNPSNGLGYSLTWSTEGVINEYGNSCYGLVDGQLTELRPLEGLESIQLDGRLYEAFNTSGGLGSLAETYRGVVRNMTYKTIRYPGHCAAMKLLMFDLKMNDDRQTLKRILENALPRTLQDVVLIYVNVIGKQSGELLEENLLYKVYPQALCGQTFGAIQVTTAAGLTAVLDLILSDAAAYRGFVRQEQFPLERILNNRFGRLYRQGSETCLPLIRAARAAAMESPRIAAAVDPQPRSTVTAATGPQP